MKINHLVLTMCVIFLWGCSRDSIDEIQLPSATVFPAGRVTQVELSTQHPSITPGGDATQTELYSGQITATEPPGLPLYSNAGIEARNSDDIRLIAQVGLTWTRINGLLWHIVEPVKGTRDWTTVASLESELREASALGVETILIVRGAPEWAQKIAGSYCGPVREDQLISFGDFLYDAVSRYSQPPYNVKYWELGNEPDVNVVGSVPNTPFGCWGDSLDDEFGGGYYAEMLKIVYPRIKSADPQAQVLIGGLLLDCDPVTPPEVPIGSGQIKDCKPATFLQGILRNGGGKYFDGVAFHAYDYYYEIEGKYGNINWHSSSEVYGPVLVAKSNYLRQLLELYGFNDKFLMNTEGALICGQDGTEPGCSNEYFDNTKASYIVQSFTLSRVLDLKANIWYNLHGWRGSGLLNEEGAQLPAFQALIFHATILKNADFHAEIDAYEGILGYSFKNQDSTIWVLWSLDGDVKNLQLDDPPDLLFSTLGEKIYLSTEISVDYSPIYLVWSK